MIGEDEEFKDVFVNPFMIEEEGDDESNNRMNKINSSFDFDLLFLHQKSQIPMS